MVRDVMMVDKIKLFLYKALTQAIILLGELRKDVEKKMQIVVLKSRTFVMGVSGTVECCDCCLTHLEWIPKSGTALLAQPLRPSGYDYGARFGAGKPSPFKHESELLEEFQDKWRVRT